MNNRKSRALLTVLPAVLLTLPGLAQASLFQGETLDAVANAMSWVVLVVAPAVGIAVFWLVHILPEKIAEQRQHPQAKAIQTLCLLSLAFGGLLWPLAWLWAYSKPVLYKLAYGTDRVAHGEDDSAEAQPAQPALQPLGAFDVRPSGAVYAQEFQQLRQRINELENRLAETSSGNEAGRG